MKVDGKEVNGTEVVAAYNVSDVNILTAALEFQVRLSGTRNTMCTRKCANDICAQRSTPLRQNLKLTKKLTLTLNLPLKQKLKGLVLVLVSWCTPLSKNIVGTFLVSD